jgi:hypothetical protein
VGPQEFPRGGTLGETVGETVGVPPEDESEGATDAKTAVVPKGELDGETAGLIEGGEPHGETAGVLGGGETAGVLEG